MSKSILDSTYIKFNDTADPITITSGTNTLEFEGNVANQPVSLENIEKLKLTETGGGTNQITLQPPATLTPYTVTLAQRTGCCFNLPRKRWSR